MAEAAPHGVALRRLEVAGWVAMFVYAGSTQAPSMCLPRIGEEFGLSLAGQGAIAGIRTGTLLAALLLAGHFGRRRGLGPFLVAGLGLVCLGIGGTSIAIGYTVLVASQMLLGAGNGMMEALVNPLVAELRPRDTARALNVTHALYPVGLVVSALVSGEMLARGLPWRLTEAIWLPPAIASCLLFVSRRYPPRRDGTAEAPGGLGFLRRRAFWALMVAMVLAGGCELGVTVWAPSYLERELGASARGGALAIVLFGTSMALGRFASGAILRRISPMALTAISAVLGALAMLGFGQASDARIAWAFAGFAGLTIACFWPTLLAIATEVLDDASTAMLALLAAAGIAGCALFPWLLGVLGDMWSLRAGLALLPLAMTALALLLGGMALTLRRQDREARPAE